MVVELATEKSVAGLLSLAHETRRWLECASGEEVDKRLLARLQSLESQHRYAGYMKSFFCYCLRVTIAGDSDDDAAPRLSGSSKSASSDSVLLSSEGYIKKEHPNFMHDAREFKLV